MIDGPGDDPFADLAAKPAPDAFADLAQTPTPDPFADLTQHATPPARARLPLPPMAPRDVTRTPADPSHKGTPLGPIASALTRYAFQPAAENPLTSALVPLIPGAGLVMAGAMGKDVTEYAGQKAAELSLPSDVRTIAEADPTRIPGARAAVEAGLLALPFAARGAWRALGRAADVSHGMMESGVAGLQGMQQTRAPISLEPTEGGAAPAPIVATPTHDPFADLAQPSARHSGLPVTPQLMRQAGDVWNSAMHTPFAPLERTAPEVASAAEQVLAARGATGHFSQVVPKWIAEGLSSDEAAQFGRTLLHDNHVAEAERQGAAADALEPSDTAPDFVPAKSSRGLWYTASTEGGTLRSPEEMETEPLLQELHRRADAQKRYYDSRRYGPNSAVTIRNEQQLWKIEDLLAARDGIDHEAAWNEIGRRRASGGTGAGDDFSFGANAEEPSEHVPLTFPTYQPEPARPAVGELRATAENHAAHAARLAPTLDPFFRDTPQFRNALAKYRTHVEQPIEADALAAGVLPAQMRRPASAYMRLVRGESAEEEAGTVGAGQRSATETNRTGAAETATGSAETYSSDLPTVLAAEAERRVKAAKNRFVQALAAKYGSNPATTETVTRLFNDRGDVVDSPSEATFKLHLPQDANDALTHIEQELNPPRTTTAAGRAARAARGAVGAAALIANPGAATSHIQTLAATVGGVPSGPLSTLAKMLPFAKTASGLRDIVSVDRTAPETRALESALRDQGALRPRETPRALGDLSLTERMKAALAPTVARLTAQGIPLAQLNRALNPHEILFGENGVDVRARLALAQKYVDAYQGANDGAEPPVADVARYVVKRAGNYVSGNSGALVNALQKSGLSMFARMGSARVVNAARSLTGQTDLPGNALANRAGGLATGVLGGLIGLDALNYVLSGHHLTANQPGHHADVQYGTSPDGRPRYITAADPLTRTAVNGLGVGALADHDVRQAGRDVLNTGLGVATSDPLSRAALTAVGVAPRFDNKGNVQSTGKPLLSGPDEVKARTKQALLNLTGAGQALFGDDTKNRGLPDGARGVANFTLPQLVTEGSKHPRTGFERAQTEIENWLGGVKQDLGHAATPMEQRAILQQAVQYARENKLNASVIQRELLQSIRDAPRRAGGAPRSAERYVRRAGGARE